MKRSCLLLTILFYQITINAQEYIEIWPENRMPNSKGVKVEEIITNERIRQVDVPGMYIFLPSKQENKGAAIIIYPSGGYKHLTYIIGGMQLAKWFNTLGISAFVLKYRLPHSPDLVERHKGPLQDAQRAMRIVRANAEKWEIDPGRIGVMGASAGGHLASTMATHYEDVSAIGDTLDDISFSVNFTILVSPVITMDEYTHKGSKAMLLGENPSDELIKKYSNEWHVTDSIAPCFMVHAHDDHGVSSMNSLLFYTALTEKKVPGCSLHIFPRGGHAIALRNNPGSTACWTKLCEEWLIENEIIKRVILKN